MKNIPANSYARWRAALAAPALAEGGGPPERLLQAVWQHQRLRRDSLRTLDGRKLRVLHPGFWNHAAGPDFRGAVIQFDGDAPRSGDVEVDIAPAGWRGHAHRDNPEYRNVILHVVWDAAETSTGLPTLALRTALDSPPDELSVWLDTGAERDLPEAFAGKCSAPLKELSPELLKDLLNQAALVRLQTKADWLQARARDAGWEQALWEGLFRALGYKQNAWPMQRLGELLPALGRQEPLPRNNPLAWQGRLFGVGGLLPDELGRKTSETDRYVRAVWDCWWREREPFGEVILPRGVWRFNGLRPANHPQRRLALAAHWLAAGNLIARLENWFTNETNETEPAADSLLKILLAGADDFWPRHWTLRAAPMAKPQPLLGTTRVTDLAVNVLLPWFWIRAVAGRNAALRQRAERLYFAWPCAEDNAVLRLARQRLLGGAGRRLLATAAAQQGLMQIVRDFCERSNAVCTDCHFPELARNFGVQAANQGT
ncbi:MAG: DUF2851 family protein [Verrucomicrobia bacterium]|nr:DUF2851 family protein [Verrucomicrobiota bacterium]